MTKSHLFLFFNQLRATRRAFSKRICTLLKEKLGLVLIFNLWYSLPYFVLQRFPIFPVKIVKATPLDRLIHFDDGAVWLYLSLFLFIPVAPFLMASASQLRQYTMGLGLIALISHLSFFFYPTAIVRPDVEHVNWAYRLMLGVDRTLNASPSLHASLALFSALCCERLLLQLRQPWGWRSLLWVWTLAILWSTLATKQHVILDLVGGGLVGLTVYLLIFGERKLERKFSLDSVPD